MNFKLNLHYHSQIGKYIAQSLSALLFIFFVLSSSIQAQSVQMIKADSQDFIWGEGSGATIREADQQALADIISQISTQVESNFERTIHESGKKFTETVNDVLRTYSNATLNNTVRLIINQEPDAKVFRYIKRSEIVKVFESRKQKIIEFAKNGEQAVEKMQIADALRYFYWSQTLLRSHPDADLIKMTTSTGNDIYLTTWLPVQINDIFSNLSISIDEIKENKTYLEYILGITYKNYPVRNLDYSYWTGLDWTNIHSAKDGLGVAELPLINKSNEISMKVEYIFEGESAIDLELRDVMQRLPQIPYKNAYITANLASTETKTKPASINLPSSATLSDIRQKTSTNTLEKLSNVTDKELIIEQILKAISTQNYTSVQSLFTTEGYDIFRKLMQYGRARILRKDELKYYQHGDYVICRSVPMSFSFQNNNRTFVEDVVFTLDKHNQVCNIAFGLSKESVDDIASNDFWSENIRMLLINFMENYKTAYALKRLDYIESIFSNDALIITGSVVKVKSNAEFQFKNNQIVKYNKLSKEQYLQRLKHSFKSNEFINIRFADNNVRYSGRSDSIYGIQIKQDYFSTNYGDSGYLFLMIDFADSNSPIIHVRTWQPEKNPDGSIYGLTDF